MIKHKEIEWGTFEGYLVSNEGTVLNRKGKPVRGYKRNGYKSVSIDDKKHYVHRMVAMIFCDDYFDGAVVDHIDQNPDNNHYKNLRWVTPSENVKNTNKRNEVCKISNEVVLIIINLKNMVGLNNTQISEVTGVDRRNVSRILNGRSRVNLTGLNGENNDSI